MSERMAAAARRLEDPQDPQTTMETAVQLALSEVEGCDAAALSIVHRRRAIDTPAATHEMARAGDQLQYDTGEGPCLDAVWEERVVHSNDLARDARWPTWGPRVTEETDARSTLCFQLFTDQDRVGALNLYSRDRDGFSPTDRDEGLALAAHISIAVRAAQQISSLVAGLDHRTTIGQAQGIVMERFDLDAAGAFALLARLSQDHNVKLREVADELVRSRNLPRSPSR